MPRFFCLLFFLIQINCSSAQLQLEGSIGIGGNMSATVAHQTAYSPYLFLSKDVIHFMGVNLSTNLGARLMLLDKRWSIGAAIGYGFKYHESNSKNGLGIRGNTIYPFHLLEIPFDLNYNLKNKIGFHLGGEMAMVLSPRVTGNHLHIQDKIMVGALVGVSYTKGRFRFELLYKHYFNYYMKRTFTYQVANVSGTHTDYTFTRFHDIQFRIVVRLFSVY